MIYNVYNVIVLFQPLHMNWYQRIYWGKTFDEVAFRARTGQSLYCNNNDAATMNVKRFWTVRLPYVSRFALKTILWWRQTEWNSWRVSRAPCLKSRRWWPKEPIFLPSSPRPCLRKAQVDFKSSKYNSRLRHEKLWLSWFNVMWERNLIVVLTRTYLLTSN